MHIHVHNLSYFMNRYRFLFKGAITGPIVSYAIMLWIGIGQYSVLGIPEDFPFPTDNCQAGNGSMTGGNNITTLAVTTNLISTTGVTTMAAVPVQEL